MTNIEKLQERRPELLDQFSKMDKEQLLEACCGEALDLLDHEDRVQLFMNECTEMSITNYSLDVIKKLIQSKKDYDLRGWCKDLIDEYSDSGIVDEVVKEALKLDNKL